MDAKLHAIKRYKGSWEAKKRCLHCNKVGHIKRNCPVLKQAGGNSAPRRSSGKPAVVFSMRLERSLSVNSEMLDSISFDDIVLDDMITHPPSPGETPLGDDEWDLFTPPPLRPSFASDLDIPAPPSPDASMLVENEYWFPGMFALGHLPNLPPDLIPDLPSFDSPPPSLDLRPMGDEPVIDIHLVGDAEDDYDMDEPEEPMVKVPAGDGWDGPHDDLIIIIHPKPLSTGEEAHMYTIDGEQDLMVSGAGAIYDTSILVDTGASHHVFNQASMFVQFNEVPRGSKRIVMGGGERHEVHGVGTVVVHG